MEVVAGMRKWFRSRSLIQKIMWMIILVLIFPTFMICAFYYNSYRNSLIKDADVSLKEDMDRAGNQMEKNLDIAQSVMDEIVYGQELIYFLDAKNNLSQREISNFMESMEREWINIRYTYPNLFERMNIYSSNDQVVMNMKNNWKLTLSPMELFAEDISSDAPVCYGAPRKPTEIIRSQESSRLQIIDDAGLALPIYLPVKNVSTDEVIGVVELDMPLEKLMDVNEIEKSIPNGLFVLFDQREELVYQSGEISEKEAARIASGPRDSIFSAEMEKKEYSVFGKTNDRTGITYAMLVDQASVVKAARDMIWKVGIVAVLGILCILAMTYLLLSRMLKRLVVMDDVMGKVETGDFEVLIEDDGYEDEISRMKRRFNQMTRRLNSVIREMVEKEQAQKEAELRALQAQINPHFLYNTLETMRMQCEYDRYYKISKSLLALGDIFRYTMKWKGYEVPFSQEWANLENYISIMALRLDDDFTYELSCEEEAQKVIVPKMLLQPIVENSFQHGFKGVAAPWELKVAAGMKDGLLEIVIEDNGSGIPGEKLAHMQACIRERRSFSDQEGRQSIGIINVVQRMDGVCPPGSDVEIQNRAQGGIRIKIRIISEDV
ncbi:MAG: histidine kinase [Lachnospiraceae bacterium]|nr:histidine kinase [Lachnospiraceae bacterium]